MKGVIHKVYNETFNFDLKITFCKSSAEKESGAQINGLTGGFVAFNNNNGNLLIFIREDGGVIQLPTIAHECFHASCFILDYKGCDYASNSANEQYAYVIQWMFKKVLDCFDLEIDYINKSH